MAGYNHILNDGRLQEDKKARDISYDSYEKWKCVYENDG